MPRSGMIIASTIFLILSFVMTPSKSEQNNAGDSNRAFKVHVLLTEVSGNTANYSIQASMNDMTGSTVIQNRTVWTGSQTCPYDVDDFCYTDAGIFKFKGFKKGAVISVCNQPSYTGAERSCEVFDYHGKNEQTVRTKVVPMDPAHVPYYDPQTNKMVFP